MPPRAEIKARFEKLYSKISTEAFVERFGYKRPHTVRTVAHHYGIKKQPKAPEWAEEELSILRAVMHKKLFVRQIRAQLPQRSWRAIQKMASRLRIKDAKRNPTPTQAQSNLEFRNPPNGHPLHSNPLLQPPSPTQRDLLEKREDRE